MDMKFEDEYAENRRCANCLSDDETECFKTKINLRAGGTQVVTIYEAVSLIFCHNLVLENYHYTMCENCVEIVSRLYELYVRFKNLSRPDSDFYIPSIIKNESCTPESDNISELESFPSLYMEDFPVDVPKDDIVFSDGSDKDLKLRLERRSVRRKFCQQFSGPSTASNGMEPTYYEHEMEHDVDNDDDSMPEPRAQKRGRGRPRKSCMKIDLISNIIEHEQKRKRGRPRTAFTSNTMDAEHQEKRKPGRPRKSFDSHATEPKRKPGRPRKSPIVTSDDNKQMKKRRGRPSKPISDILLTVSEGDAGITENSNVSTSGSSNGAKCAIPGVKVHSCPHCGKQAKTARNIFLHIRGVHEAQRPFSCSFCPRRFAGKDGLTNHQRIAHPDPNVIPKEYFCPVAGCGKSFPYPSGVHAHVLIHDRALWNFQCEHCGRKCKSKQALNLHKAAHSDERKFTCEDCGALFKQRLSLRHHHRVTHPEKYGGIPVSKLTCQICRKKFMTPWNMRLHVRSVHNQIKPYRCYLCSKYFSCTSNLRVHLKGFHSMKDVDLPVGELSGGQTYSDYYTQAQAVPPY